jgi:hypothetical protein
MKAKQLLLVVILVGATGALILNVGKDKNMIEQITPATVQLPIEGELPSKAFTYGKEVNRTVSDGMIERAKP